MPSSFDDFDLSSIFSGIGDFVVKNPGLVAAGAGALAGGLGGGDKPQTTSTSTIAPFQMPYLQQGFAEAQRLFQQGGISPYPTSQVAPLSQVTTSAIGNIANPNNAKPYEKVRDYLSGQMGRQFNANDAGLSDAAKRAGNLTAAQATAADSGEASYISDTLGGKYLGKNPYLDATYEKIARSIQGSADSQFASGGRLNSGAAQRALATGLGDAATSLYGQNYEAERGRMDSAAQLGANRSGQANQISIANAGAQNQAAQFGVGAQINALDSLGRRQDAQQQFGANYGLQAGQGATQAQDSLQRLYGGQAAAGGVLDSYAQNVLSDNVGRYQQSQQQPFDNVARYLESVRGNYGSSSTSSQAPNRLATALGGASAGLGLYGQLFGGSNDKPQGGYGSQFGLPVFNPTLAPGGTSGGIFNF